MYKWKGPGFLKPGPLRDGEEGDRTLGLRIANAALSQLSYFPASGSLVAEGYPVVKASVRQPIVWLRLLLHAQEVA